MQFMSLPEIILAIAGCVVTVGRESSLLKYIYLYI